MGTGRGQGELSMNSSPSGRRTYTFTVLTTLVELESGLAPNDGLGQE
jgi:hypothetical protein